jgi:hypothetical protein
MARSCMSVSNSLPLPAATPSLNGCVLLHRTLNGFRYRQCREDMQRNLAEGFFNKLKHFCAVATRYDKLGKIFLAGVQLASAIILLN